MKKLLLVLCISILIVLSVGCSSNAPEVSPEDNQKGSQEVSPEKKPEVNQGDSSQISEESLTGSAKVVEMYGEIENAEVTIENNKISFYLTPTDQEISKERLRELSIIFLKALSGYTVNDGLQGPTDESYGQIYDYYDVEMIVEGDRGEVLYTGTKANGENEIKWQE